MTLQVVTQILKLQLVASSLLLGVRLANHALSSCRRQGAIKAARELVGDEDGCEPELSTRRTGALMLAVARGKVRVQRLNPNQYVGKFSPLLTVWYRIRLRFSSSGEARRNNAVKHCGSQRRLRNLRLILDKSLQFLQHFFYMFSRKPNPRDRPTLLLRRKNSRRVYSTCLMSRTTKPRSTEARRSLGILVRSRGVCRTLDISTGILSIVRLVLLLFATRRHRCQKVSTSVMTLLGCV